jgi:nicotinamide-nucleotide amidase
MRVNLLLTGNELMAGDIVDSNSALIAQRFAARGWSIREKRTIGDDLELLIHSLRELARDADVLLVNGGLGPTVDDLTAEALAAAARLPLQENPRALAHIESWCRRLNMPLSAANRKQAILPYGCGVIPNTVGTAVGFELVLEGCRVLCTPGVPRELERMLDDCILPALGEQFGAGTLRVHKTATFGIGESALQQRISDCVPDWPASVDLGFRASFPLLELKLATRDAEGEAALERLLPVIEPLLAEFRIERTLPNTVVQLLGGHGRKLTVAESCTGGLIASLLTQIPGASAAFDAGFVTYSNAMKQAMLGVDAQTLEREGAVSEAVVLQMAAGALRVSGADYAIAVSGIAGPDGGTEEKPVGTVWIAWGDAADLRARRLQLGDNRAWFQQYTASIGLDLIRRRLLGLDEAPRYLSRHR